MEKSPSLFLAVNEFKAQVASVDAQLQVLRNKETGKLFMSIGGQNYKVEAAIDKANPMKVLVPIVDGEPDYDNACLININGGAEEQFTL